MSRPEYFTTSAGKAAGGPDKESPAYANAAASQALDLLMQGIVEQARLATRATGAAIALAGSGEMVCRATAGENAPGLGLRLDTRFGLSGECVRSRVPQLCDDAELDPRVDAEASRILGIRSVLIVPIKKDESLLGVLEIFSPRPHAFGDRDVQTLQALSRRIVGAIRDAEQPPLATAEFAATEIIAPVEAEALKVPAVTVEKPALAVPEILPLAAVPPKPVEPAATVAPVETSMQETTRVGKANAAEAEEEEEESEAGSPRIDFPNGSFGNYGPLPPKRGDSLWMLNLVVIAVAVLLGWAIAAPRLKGIVGFGGPATAPASAAESSPPTESVATSEPDAPPPAKPLTQPAVKVGKIASSEAAPSDGLTIYEKGKIIYREPLRPAAGLRTQLTAEAASGLLLQRVEPEYPQTARDRQVQGAVVLDLVVGEDGSVRSAHVISGDSALAGAASAAVMRWRFRPFVKAGKAAEFETRTIIEFRLP